MTPDKQNPFGRKINGKYFLNIFPLISRPNGFCFMMDNVTYKKWNFWRENGTFGGKVPFFVCNILGAR